MATDRTGPARVVSSDDELLIVVDEKDRPIGSMSKRDCHDGQGILHRAFSVFLFDQNDRLLIQQRAAGKRLWPLYWANSCCSHPRVGETLAAATRRRLREELGASARLEFVYRFRYQAPYGELGAEHELCSVYVGRLATERLQPNPEELADWRFAGVDAVDQLMAERPNRVAPWFRMEWRDLRGQYRDRVRQLLADAPVSS